MSMWRRIQDNFNFPTWLSLCYDLSIFSCPGICLFTAPALALGSTPALANLVNVLWDCQCPPPAGLRHSFHPEGFWALRICIITQSSVQGWVSFQKNDWVLKRVSGNSARPLKKYLPKRTLYVKSKGLLAIMLPLVIFFFFPKVLVPPFLLSVNTKEKANSN